MITETLKTSHFKQTKVQFRDGLTIQIMTYILLLTFKNSRVGQNNKQITKEEEKLIFNKAHRNVTIKDILN